MTTENYQNKTLAIYFVENNEVMNFKRTEWIKKIDYLYGNVNALYMFISGMKTNVAQ